ncbi:anhydro-N-acetylmuramic acid kinase [Pararhizobium capsulatum DSM 1112]|uniref:Anhydro-N-acetylmuramic acid kinase n=1 Tax=Pararhizobium capsulatum DSM 1112 TaxID=1121113 RepID=A0ABU0BQC5_9HYPH|nr:anhydro-N-acetylmuramic acid kinase [Pararhizobium capsulatum]MDQ0320448.1 anhydro-N-acetylmuramic acid kinase [Pararhizobium capsulatum DSM 1112]
MKAVWTSIGLMSGTSMDGIDIALLRTDGDRQIERAPSMSVPYEAGFRDRLKQGLVDAKKVTDRKARPADLGALERNLTIRHAVAVSDFLFHNGLKHGDINVIGFHGQTVLHRPDEALTVQLGDGQLLADLTGIPVVYDMRANDMRHGGQGAPLIPVYHSALARSLDDRSATVFVNIGGISNLTFIGTKGEIVAYDSGPGNTLIDQWVELRTGQAFDEGGAIADRGKVLSDLAARYLEHPFFVSNRRRSLDRNDFRPPSKIEAGLEDGARTLAYVTAAAILKSASHLPESPKRYVVCGGGRHNQIIMTHLEELARLNGASVIKAEALGFDGDAMEAEAWAYLAVRSQLELPLTFPGTTGVSHAVSGGVLAKPSERAIPKVD